MHSQSRNLEFENEKIKNFLVLKKSALIKHKSQNLFLNTIVVSG